MIVVAQAVNDLHQGGRALPRLAANAHGAIAHGLRANSVRLFLFPFRCYSFLYDFDPVISVSLRFYILLPGLPTSPHR